MVVGDVGDRSVHGHRTLAVAAQAILTLGELDANLEHGLVQIWNQKV